jgi:hypothetical protein
MYSLKNDSLEVLILDPLADQARFGTRYCTGGYIFQITDSQIGELLSGPTYPESFNTFDGQGIPDAFNLSPLREPASTDPTALIIGIGLCDLQANQVLEFCQWEIKTEPSRLRLRTQQSFQSFTLELERTITLHRRTVRSAIHLKNTSQQRVIPVRWFPHPFYPQPATDELCRLNIPVSFPDNPAYELAGNGFICRKSWPWQAGHFQPLDHNAQSNLTILQKHPHLGLIAATCSYVPDFFPIWGNQYTFSWEPYLERTLAMGQEISWWIDYDF